ncbi:GbpC/Spa domain-containing protein [Gemella bergeri]
MSTKLKEKGRKASTLFLSLLMLLSVSTQNLTTHAADKDKGIEVTVDRTELDKSVKQAQDAGVNVKKESNVDKGVAVTKAEADRKIAEIKDDYNQQIQKLKQAKQELDKYNAEKAEYDKKKQEYDKKLAEYNKKKQEYDKALKELEKHKNEDGYLKSPIGQPLIFESESNAVLNIKSGGVEYKKGDFYKHAESLGYLQNDDKLKKELVYKHIKDFDNAPDKNGKRVFLKYNQPLVARYTNLQKSYMNGKKISAVEYIYTLKSTGGLKKTEIPAFLYSDPTITVRYWAFFNNIRIAMEVKMYDEYGKEIDTTGALLDFQSLNRGHGYPQFNGKNAIEKVSYYTGEPLEINGSSVKAHGINLFADKSNYATADGSKYASWQWDSETSPLNWYGAIVGKQTRSSIQFDMESDNCVNVWFGFDSKIKPKDIPIEPTPPTPPVEPKKPDIQVNYHYDILYVKSQVEKKVTDEADKDINNATVQTGSVVKFKLQTSNFPAGHEEIKSLVFKDVLPDGYEFNLEGTKQASSDYDVTYDKDSRLLTFKAKDTLLSKINADLTKEAQVPSPIITGKVTKEGTKYENHFDLDINNVYKVTSEPVKVNTPVKPSKKVFTGQDTTNIDGKVVKPNQELTYKIDYKNTTGKTQEVEITDVIPKFTKYIENSASDNGAYDNSTKKLTWKKTVEDGKEWSVTFKVKVDSDVNGKVIDNIGHTKDAANSFDTNITSNPTPKEPVKDVVDNKGTTINGKVVKPGETLTYTVEYKNTTDQDRDVTIKDKIPAYTTYVENSADNNGKFADGQVTWSKKVAKGDSWKVTFKVKVNDDTNGVEVINKARVADGVIDIDTNPTNNPTPKKPVKDVVNESGTTINGKAVKPGDILTYTVSYTNTTGEDRDVTIKDKIPEYTTYVENSADNNGKYTNGEVVWTKRVAKGETWTVTFKVKVNEETYGKEIKNIARTSDGVLDIDTNPTTNPVPPKTPPVPPTTPKTPLPKTGNEATNGVYAGLATLLAGLGLALRRKRKDEE